MNWAPKFYINYKDLSLLKKKHTDQIEDLMRKHREKEDTNKKAEDETRNAKQSQWAEQDFLKSEIENNSSALFNKWPSTTLSTASWLIISVTRSKIWKIFKK